MIKLIASDVDGTLLHADEFHIPDRVFRMIRRVVENGIVFVVASGRSYAALRHMFEPVADEAVFVSHDGALCMHKGRQLDIHPIERNMAINFFDAIAANGDSNVVVSGKVISYYTNLFGNPGFEAEVRNAFRSHVTSIRHIDEVCEPIVKLSVYSEKGTFSRGVIVQQVEKLGLTQAYQGGSWCEYTAPGVHKGLAIQTLKQKLGIGSEQCMAFGDNINDIEMMQQVEYSYAMINSKKELKDSSRYRTGDVVQTLEELVLRRRV